MKNSKVLVVDDEEEIRLLVAEILTEEGYDVASAGNATEAREARSDNDFDLVLLDIWMPDTDGISLLGEWAETGLTEAVVMMSGHGTIDTAVEATRLGAVEYIEKPISLSKLLRTVERVLSARRGGGNTGIFSQPAPAPVGKSAAIRALRESITRAARHDTHVMITGEPGSGKELAARYLAGQSNRSSAPLVVVNCAELTTDNAATRLLGAGQERGLLDRAEGGVLVLNNLPDASVAARVLLLKCLRSNQYESSTLGLVPLDVRVLSCAPPGFERSQKFDAELLAMLSVVVINVPALRDYHEDVPELLRYYVELFIDSEQLPFRRFSIGAQNRLRNYPWPGNVRELRNLVKRLLIMGTSEEIALSEVETNLEVTVPEDEPLIKQDLLALPLREAREQFERAYLQQQLILCNGKVGQLAKRVGMERTHLYRKLRALGVDFRHGATDE